jgi:NTE family protein
MKTGLVLSGGGARGVVHLGIIQALEEFGVKFDYISGTSAGAIVGALYSYGYKPEAILKIINTTSFFKSLSIAWTWKGLLKLDGLHKMMLKYIPENTFASLKIPLTVAATDIKKGKIEYITQGDLISAVLASSCVPAVFDPIQREGVYYVDGGILDNLPVKAIQDKCDFIIGSHCNFISSEFDLKNFRTVIERSLLMAINGNTTVSKTLCNLLIEPTEIGTFSGFDLSKAQEIFDIGYQHTKKNFSSEHFKL